MHIKDIIFNLKNVYNLIKLDAAYTIKLTKIIEVLNFKLPIIENPPYNKDFEDDKVIKPTEDI